MATSFAHGDIARWKEAFVTDDAEREELFVVLEPLPHPSRRMGAWPDCPDDDDQHELP